MQCPWTQYTPDPYPFCEEQLCGWIREPANTWSNIGFLIAAIMIYKNSNLNSLKKPFAFVTFALFVGSTLFHLTATLWAKYLDVGAMLMLSSLLLSLSLKWRFALSSAATYIIATNMFVVSAFTIGYKKLGGVVFLAQVGLAAALEFKRYALSSGQPERRKNLLKAIVIFPILFVINMLDQQGVLCVKSNHILTGHGIWHLGAAYCIYLISCYYCWKDEPLPIPKK